MKTSILLISLALLSHACCSVCSQQPTTPQPQPDNETVTTGEEEPAKDEVCPELGDGVNAFPHRDARKTP